MTEQPEDMRFSAFSWDILFFLRKSFIYVLILPACEPAAPPWLCPSALPAALWPPILRQVFQYWLSGSVLTSVSLSHCFAQAALFNRQKKNQKKKKTGARVVWTVLQVYLTCQGGERMWERATQRLFVRLEHLGPMPGQRGGKRAGRRWYLLSLWVDWIEKTNCNAKGCSFQDSAGIGWERTEKVGWRKPLFLKSI